MELDTDDPVICPWCGCDVDLERRGAYWFCPACVRCWVAFNADDRVFLKVNKIDPR